MKALLALAIKEQRGLVRLAILCAVLAAISAVGLLAVSGWFLASAGLAGAAGVAAVQGFNYLLPSAFIRATAITRTGARYGERMLGHRAALFALAKLRGALFMRVAAGVLMAKDAGQSGVFAARIGQDVDVLEDAIIRRIAGSAGWVATVAALIASMALGWRAALVLAIGMATMPISARLLANRKLPAAYARQAQALTRLKADYADVALPVADIAVYGLSQPLAAALAPAYQAYADARAAAVRAEAFITAIQTLLATITLIGVLLFASASLPQLALGLLGTMAGLEIAASMATHAVRTPQLALAEARLEALPSGVAQIVNLPSAPSLMISGHALAPGERVRIVGPSGSGKTRLIETLAGLRRDAPQQISVTGLDPRKLGLASLRASFSLVSQHAPLIAGSVADNLMLARAGLSEAELWAALKVACADDVVLGLPDGLHQWLGDDGARLSGGQRRRIAIARALLAQRPWLILDEASEGLDAATEARLGTSLDHWLSATGTGLILVSHRKGFATLAPRYIEILP